MSSLSMVEAKLPPGFRFHPTDDELVCDYLLHKWNASHHSHPLLTEVDLNKCEPWDIPERACIGGKEWYFYSQRDRKYATGLRTNRATVSGYWKATGKDRAVVRRGTLVGMRKTLVFYQGRAPKGHKTEWVMHEFRLEPPFALSSPSKEDWVLCRVFFKNKEGSGKSGGSENERNKTTVVDGESATGMTMDSYIRFDQTTTTTTQANADAAYQQVPCFSMFSGGSLINNNSNNNNPTIATSMLMLQQQQQNYHMMHPNANSNNNMMTMMMAAEAEEEEEERKKKEGIIMRGGACDKKVLEAVLSELTKMETINGGSPSIGEAASSESYLSEVGLQQPSSLWPHF
ncbi:hypothetical protein vseg_007621 [Gypsophila vaccaria]